MRLRDRIALSLGASAIALAAGTAALAADEPKTTNVGEIVVTAERTRENIMKVGVNVTAVSSDQLQRSRIASATDLATIVPNFEVKTNIPACSRS